MYVHYLYLIPVEFYLQKKYMLQMGCTNEHLRITFPRYTVFIPIKIQKQNEEIVHRDRLPVANI